MVGLLYALPNTQLTRRLASEGRLHADLLLDPAAGMDQCTQGLNFDTLRPRSEILSDYKRVLEKVYDPVAYAKRLQRLVASARQLQPQSASARERFSGASLADWRLSIGLCPGCQEHKTSLGGRSFNAHRQIRNGLELSSC